MSNKKDPPPSYSNVTKNNWSNHQRNLVNPFPYSGLSQSMMLHSNVKLESQRNIRITNQIPITIDLTEESEKSNTSKSISCDRDTSVREMGLFPSDCTDTTGSTLVSTPVNNRPTDKGMCPLQKGPIVTVTNDNSTKDYNVEKQYSFHDSFSEDSSLEDIAEHSRTGFYETQPSWMSNTTWCWHKADRDVTVGNNTIFDAENAQEIMLEESIAMKKGKHAVSRVREKYKHDISSLSPVDKQKIKKTQE